ncbi:hypothetical protein, partial [Escherichia coli]|uniref:hypothetical protein n=1 Tax=Escherichia coli TaxID=562 RepID=UPI001BC97314
AAPSAKGDDKFITTDYLQQCLQLHQQKGMISLSPPTICNSAVLPAPRFIKFLKTKGPRDTPIFIG